VSHTCYVEISVALNKVFRTAREALGGSHTLRRLQLRLVTFLLPEAYLEGLDKLLGQGRYPSRSAAIRFAVLDMLKRELWQQERETAKEEVSTTRKGRMRRPPRPPR